jgi:hypothetical protein
MKRSDKNPWPIVSVAVSLIAIIITIILNLTARSEKELQVQILSNTSLISINPDISSNTQVYFNHEPVQSLSLILLKFINIGNEPIIESDYSQPIRILISPNANISEVSIQESKPEGINFTPTIKANNEVEIERVLMNPNDQVVLKIIAMNNDDTLEISGRIVGIKEIEIVAELIDESHWLVSNIEGLRNVFTIGMLVYIVAIIIFLTIKMKDPESMIRFLRSLPIPPPISELLSERLEYKIMRSKSTEKFNEDIAKQQD